MTTTVAPTLSLDEACRPWSVVVVGSGPAGTAAAIELARRGIDTLLVDRKPMPRNKVCGGCVNLSSLRSLEALGIADRLRDQGARPLERLRLFAGGRRARLSLPGGVSVTRACMDAVLTRRAVREGASFLPETTASIGEAAGEHRRVTLVRHGRAVGVEARVVVVAAGLGGQQLCSSELHFSRSADSRVGVGLVTEGVPEAVDDGSICMAVACHGYVGLARAERGLLSVAAAVDPRFARRHGPAAACQRILDEAGLELSLAELPGSWTGTVTLTRRPVQPASWRLVCVGDSAGYVEPFTGEGIAWGLRSGRLVAPLVERGLVQWTPAIESEWCAVYARNVRRGQRLCRWITRGLRHPWLVANALTACQHVPWLVNPLVGRIGGAGGV